MMMRPTTSPPRIIHLVMIAFAAGTVPVDAKTGHNVATLQEAVRTYDAAMVTMDPEARGEAFRRAGRLFTRVIKTAEVRNASLYVNLGNATLQANEPGRAILAYRRALELHPGHAQALRNLEHARAMLPDWVPRPASTGIFDTFFFWFREMSHPARRLAIALVFAAAAGLIVATLISRRRWTRNFAVAIILAWIAFTATDAWQDRPGRSEEVVVTAPRAIARSADSNGAPPRFADPLPAGAEVSVVARRDAWVQIRLADGRDGWVRENAVTNVVLP